MVVVSSSILLLLLSPLDLVFLSDADVISDIMIENLDTLLTST